MTPFEPPVERASSKDGISRVNAALEHRSRGSGVQGGRAA